MNPLSAERVRELLNYDPETGVFTWRQRRAGVRFGHPTGCPGGGGGLVIRVDGSLRKAHRLAWLYVHGFWPEQEIDHIDGDPTNNRIANLRDVSRRTNQQNLRRASSRSSCGVQGVCRNGKNGWMATIGYQGKSRYLGTFRTTEEAHAAYVAAKRELHPGNTL